MKARNTTMANVATPAPFSGFSPVRPPGAPLRAAISAATLRREEHCLPPLLAAARCQDEALVSARARLLVEGMRRKTGRAGVEALLHEYGLANEEGVALMCLSEALLRIPDPATRDALIRDTMARGDWLSHLGQDRPLFVNAVTWGLAISGRITATADDARLAPALSRLISRCGEPVVRAGVNVAMRMLGEQFVAGATIDEALRRCAPREARGYRYSYDMLGEAAMTSADAQTYFGRYAAAIEAVGRAARGAGPTERPGVSVKLSALHPRYCLAQTGRVMAELGPRLKELALLAHRHDISMTIDAEEADRLDLSLDLFERLRLDPALAGWPGLGFAVQAYGKRCPFVIDWLVDLAGRAGVQIMVRLVKGAYWDTEIRRAQAAGLAGLPVFTRKVYTDVSWLACARRLLEAGDAVFPQFATHNARSIASILALTGERAPSTWEFQCLHGMGEPLYDQLAGEGAPCRIYAPVGPHDTLLTYLVRRLLENGANNSFINLVADPETPAGDLAADPVAQVEAMTRPGAPHPAIRAPRDLYGLQRRNSSGLDLADAATLGALQEALAVSTRRCWSSAPAVATQVDPRPARKITSPGDRRDHIGLARDLDPDDACAVLAAARPWTSSSANERASCLERAADMIEARRPALMGLLIREAGKTAANALGEVREAADFLRYYAVQARALAGGGQPLGVTLCISPWNFPLAIFTGQIAAALAAGNAVVAKPAPETPLVAAEATRILHEAGVPLTALQLAPGDGDVGAALAVAPGVDGVLFTGSTHVARKLAQDLASCSGADGTGPVLIAETGGLNCMIADSSALPEQVVADALASAFDSAGQRCSALRVLCLQEEIAGPTLRMLRGAMHELVAGPGDCLATDVGPVISESARSRLEAHIARLASAGCPVDRLPLPAQTSTGTFVAPALIEIASLADVTGEAFGPVLHVLRWRRNELDALITAINATGYALTFGLHSRLQGAVGHITSRIRAGNVYVNRNMIGAVVGSQPFGGRGLSGTGPKAGGPLMVRSLTREGPSPFSGDGDAAALAFAAWLQERGKTALALAVLEMAARAAPAGRASLPGPAGETNLLVTRPAGPVLLAPTTTTGFYSMIGAVLSVGGREAVIVAPRLADAEPPPAMRLHWRSTPGEAGPLMVALAEGDGPEVLALRRLLAAREGPIVPVLCASSAAISADPALWSLARLLDETCISTNTAAAGGDPALLAAAAQENDSPRRPPDSGHSWPSGAGDAPVTGARELTA